MDVSHEVSCEEKESCGNTFNVDNATNPIIGDKTIVNQNTDCRKYTNITINFIPDGPKGMQLIINPVYIQTRINTLYSNHSYPSPYILVNELIKRSNDRGT